jgi:hypothetical protein
MKGNQDRLHLRLLTSDTTSLRAWEKRVTKSATYTLDADCPSAPFVAGNQSREASISLLPPHMAIEGWDAKRRIWCLSSALNWNHHEIVEEGGHDEDGRWVEGWPVLVHGIKLRTKKGELNNTSDAFKMLLIVFAFIQLDGTINLQSIMWRWLATLVNYVTLISTSLNMSRVKG